MFTHKILSSAFKTQYGPWACVTGASSGIGKAIAQQLAAAGFHLVLIARNVQRLASLATDWQKTYGIQIKIISADLSSREGIESVTHQSNTFDVGLFIAAAGFGTSGTFLQSNVDQEINMLAVNCGAVLSLTHVFAKRFAAQQRGGIILLSSIVAFQGVPYAAHYAATKAYIQSLAEGLAIELKPYNVDVLAAAPGPVHSGFAERAGMVMSNALQPEEVALPILKALGRKSIVYPGILTKFLTYSLRTVPRWGKIRIMKMVMQGMIKHRDNNYVSQKLLEQ
jgi:uncharacterized protein